MLVKSRVYSGSYQNKEGKTAPGFFDHVGFLGGAALFNSASANNQIAFTNLVVTFGGK